ncbi:MAG: hypothetical protein R3B06_05060 [Kofleriaceae bacterium]
MSARANVAHTPTPAIHDRPLLAFSWGYEAWGNHTAELVQIVDAIEESRGFRAPLLVDVRLRRQVRAIGFRERAFEKVLGPGRYLWLPGLGNRAIADRSLSMALDDPAAAASLLELIHERAAAGSRVIFFCSCGSPLARRTCHRGMVVDALLTAARDRQTLLSIQEWPGGSPCVTSLDISPDRMARLQVIAGSDDGGRMRLPVPANVPLVRAAALPHFSLIRCRAGVDESVAMSGPAVFTSAGWMFPVHTAWSGVELGALCDEMDEVLALAKLLPFGADLVPDERWRIEALVGAGAGRDRRVSAAPEQPL